MARAAPCWGQVRRRGALPCAQPSPQCRRSLRESTVMTTPAPPDADALLAALDTDQRAVAEQLTGPVCVLAGAGTGKTRAITYRIAHGVAAGVYNPTTVLAVTFTARAAGEMRSRLRDLGVGGVQARTFHAAALRQLSYFWPTTIGGSVPRIMEHKAPLIGEAAGRLGMSVDRLAIRDLAAEVEWAKVSLITPDDYPRASTCSGRERSEERRVGEESSWRRSQNVLRSSV